MSTPRVVIVRRATERDELIARHGTRGQAEFFLATRDQAFQPVEERHHRTVAALETVRSAIPGDWRRGEVERAELSRFVFEPADLVVVVGQDGLVANVAKYLDGQPVIGVDPLPGAGVGVLVPHQADDVSGLLDQIVAGRARIAERAMVEVATDDGQHLTALNEVFLGQIGHQSARYTLTVDGVSERQSSSGLIVSTGTGATGWCASIARVQAPQLSLPAPTAPTLAWFVREAWPSPTTGADLIAGLLDDQSLCIRVESDSLVAFGDGIESDRLSFSWGQQVEVRRAEKVLRTVR